MRVPSLPLELLGKIIAEVPREAGDQESERQIALLCLVAKSFLPFAREQLYTDEALLLEDDEKEESNEEDDGEPQRWELSARSCKLLATLTSEPHFSTLVRQLVLGFEAAEDPTSVHEILLKFSPSVPSSRASASSFQTCHQARTLPWRCSRQMKQSQDAGHQRLFLGDGWIAEDAVQAPCPRRPYAGRFDGRQPELGGSDRCRLQRGAETHFPARIA